MRQVRLGLICVLSSLLWFQIVSYFLPDDFALYLVEVMGVFAGVHNSRALSVMNVIMLVSLVLVEIQSRVDAPSQRHIVELLLAARRERALRLLIPLSIFVACCALWWVTG